MEERKKLLESQKELLNIKRMAIRQAEMDFQFALNQIAVELGVKPEYRDKWRLDKTGEYLECIQQPQMNVPKGGK